MTHVGAPMEQVFAADYRELADWLPRLVGDAETGQEIASDAFVWLLSKWSSPGNLDNPRSYPYKIATKAVLDHARTRLKEALRAARLPRWLTTLPLPSVT